MLIPAAERRIRLCVAPTDMRRSFDGLAALAGNHLGTATAHLGAVTEHLDTVTTAYETLKADYAVLRDQLDWFKRQLFGRHSEKRLEYDPTEQTSLFEALDVEDAPAPEVPTEEIRYRRRRKCRGGAVNDSGLRFDESVPVTTIEVEDPAVEAIPESERVLVGENVTCRLAQERASYRVLRYVLPVVKRRDTGELVSARAPGNVLERTTADVSLLAGMLGDKFRHHLPLHRICVLAQTHLARNRP